MQKQHNKQKKIILLRLALKIIAVMFFTELIIMLGASLLSNEKFSPLFILFDAAILSVISLPLIYFLILHPFIKKNQALEEKLYKLASHDHLTGLANRSLLTELLDPILAQHGRENKIGAVLYIDINKFKEINDRYGHESGDVALSFIAEKLKQILRSGDTAFRIGGDEFVAILQNTGKTRLEAAENIKKICRRLHLYMEDGCLHNKKRVEITISIGAALFPTQPNTCQQVVKLADEAMYEAKKNSVLDCVCHKQTLSNLANQQKTS